MDEFLDILYKFKNLLMGGSPLKISNQSSEDIEVQWFTAGKGFLVAHYSIKAG